MLLSRPSLDFNHFAFLLELFKVTCCWITFLEFALLEHFWSNHTALYYCRGKIYVILLGLSRMNHGAQRTWAISFARAKDTLSFECLVLLLLFYLGTFKPHLTPLQCWPSLASISGQHSNKTKLKTKLIWPIMTYLVYPECHQGVKMLKWI